MLLAFSLNILFLGLQPAFDLLFFGGTAVLLLLILLVLLVLLILLVLVLLILLIILIILIALVLIQLLFQLLDLFVDLIFQLLGFRVMSVILIRGAALLQQDFSGFFQDADRVQNIVIGLQPFKINLADQGKGQIDPDIAFFPTRLSQTGRPT